MTPSIYSVNNGWLPTLFNDIFNDSWMPVSRQRYAGNTPAINVSELPDEFKVEVAAPGMTKDDFNIQISHDGDMVINMEKKTETKDDNKKYLRREFSYSKFQQVLTLPDSVERSRISASMNDGVLTIDLPKKTEEEHAKELTQIEIK